MIFFPAPIRLGPAPGSVRESVGFGRTSSPKHTELFPDKKRGRLFFCDGRVNILIRPRPHSGQ